MAAGFGSAFSGTFRKAFWLIRPIIRYDKFAYH
jgi:hypothetical protein